VGLYNTSVTDAEQMFSDLLPLWRQADVRIGNLEAVCTARTRPAGSIGSCMRAQPQKVALLRDAGFTAMTVANNHCLDFGSDGLAESVNLLEQAGIHTCGHAPGPGQCGAPAIFEVKGIRIGMLGFCDHWRVPVSEPITRAPSEAVPETMERAVAELSSNVNLIIVQVHWGYEFALHPLRMHRDTARRLAAAGAHLVLCHHAHVPMGVERYGNSVIAHGLGNFLMPPDEYMSGGHQWSERSFVLQVFFGPEGVHGAEIIPHSSHAGPSVRRLQGSRHSFFLRALARMSSTLNDTERLDRYGRVRTIYEAFRTTRGLFAASGTELAERAALLTTLCYRQLIQQLSDTRTAAGSRIAEFFATLAAQVPDAAALDRSVKEQRHEVERAISHLINTSYRWQDAVGARIP
jgi:hypothetical protein